jgi:dTDP-4-dehydrorhamnose reductase
MNILITGSSGLLGSSIFEHLKNQGENVIRFNRDDFSWVDQKKNIENFKGIDIVIHAAANTDVENCEENPEACYRDNTLFTERLALASNSANCKFIFISSTGIYGLKKDIIPYSEYDLVNPTTHHHKCKWIAEQSVNNYCKNSLVLRTGWIFGGSPNNLKNFVTNRILEAFLTKEKKIFSNIQQLGSPTYTFDFAHLLYFMIKRDEVGTFNIVNEGFASRYDYVSKIIEIAQIDIEVIPSRADSFSRKAKVSNNEMAVSMKLDLLGYERLPNWEISLVKYIRNDLNNWFEEIKLNAKS